MKNIFLPKTDSPLTEEKNNFPLSENSSLLRGKNILIIVPAYNEQGNVSRTVQEIFSLNLPLSIVVVNDGSTDKTAQEASQTDAMVISLPFNLGIGGAVQTGFKFAAQKGFDVAVQMDGDGQHNVQYLEKLIEPILKNEVDMMIGSRFLVSQAGYRSSLLRRIGINFFAHLISFITDCKVTDPTSGFRAYNKKMIKVFAEYYPQDFPEPEAIVVAKRYQARIKEVPVEMRKRFFGNSSIGYLKSLYYMVKVTFAILWTN